MQNGFGSKQSEVNQAASGSTFPFTLPIFSYHVNSFLLAHFTKRGAHTHVRIRTNKYRQEREISIVIFLIVMYNKFC